MPTLQEETARAFRICQLQRRRWQRVYDAFVKEPMRLEHFEQLLRACRAATEIEYRQSARRMFDVFDRLASELLPREGKDVTDGQKAQLLARAEWHRKLANESRKDDVEHAAMHQRLAEQLADYAHNGIPSEPKAAETRKATTWRPGMRSRL